MLSMHTYTRNSAGRRDTCLQPPSNVNIIKYLVIIMISSYSIRLTSFPTLHHTKSRVPCTWCQGCFQTIIMLAQRWMGTMSGGADLARRTSMVYHRIAEDLESSSLHGFYTPTRKGVANLMRVFRICWGDLGKILFFAI